MDYEQLKSLIEGQSENASLDFKGDTPLNLQRLAKDLIAMSNVRDGGTIIVGVSETSTGYEPTGVTDENIKTYNKDIMKDKLSKYTDPAVDFDIYFPFDKSTQRTYVVIKVYPFKELPVLCVKDWDKHLVANTIYYRNTNRRVESSAVSNAHDLRAIIEHAAIKIQNKYQDYGINISTKNRPLKFITPHNIPALPNDYIRRDVELNEIAARLNSQNRPLLLLNGEGGIGKTTIAYAFGKENIDNYKHLAYFSGDSNLTNSFSNIFHYLGIDNKPAPEGVSLFDLTLQYLQNLPEKCLLLIDNANNRNDLQEFLKKVKGLHWHILITTRCVGITENEYVINHLAPENAKTLFKKFYNENTLEFENLLDRFLKLINYNTLILELYSKFLKEASENGETLASLLSKLQDRGILIDGEEIHLKSVAWTEQSSYSGDQKLDSILDALYDYTKLNEENRTLLLILSLLGVNTITIQDLHEIIFTYEKKNLRNNLVELVSNGWISSTGEGIGKIYKLSPVIRILSLEKNRNYISSELVSFLTNRISTLLDFEDNTLQYLDKIKWLDYANHLMQSKLDFHPLELVRLINRQVGVLRALGDRTNLEISHTLLLQALEVGAPYFKEYSVDFYNIKTNYSLILIDLTGQENLKKAEDTLRQLLEDVEKHEGKYSLNYLQNIQNLSSIFEKQGNRKNIHEGISLLRDALENSYLKNTPYAKDCLAIKSNLALLLSYFGEDSKNLNESKKLLEDCLHIFEERSPYDLYSINKTRVNLSAVLKLLGGEENLLRCKELLIKAIKYAEENFGHKSLITGNRKLNLSSVYHVLGGPDNIRQSVEIIREVLEIYKSHYGNDHLEVTNTKYKLASYLMFENNPGNLEESKNLFEDSLSVYSLEFNSSISRTIHIQWSLCNLYTQLDIKLDCASRYIKHIYRVFREKKYPLNLNEKEILDLSKTIYCKLKNIPNQYIGIFELTIWLHSENT